MKPSPVPSPEVERGGEEREYVKKNLRGKILFSTGDGVSHDVDVVHMPEGRAVLGKIILVGLGVQSLDVKNCSFRCDYR